MKQSGLGIASLILGIIGMLTVWIVIGILPCIIGLILSIVVLCSKNRKKGFAIAGLCCSILGILFFGFLVYIINIPEKESESNDVIIEETMQVPESTNIPTSEPIPTLTPMPEPTPTPTPEPTPEPAVEVFSTDLLNSWSKYIGEKVTVSYSVDRCEDDEESIQSVYDENAKLYIRSYVDNYRQFEYGDYITVTGIVDSQYASYIEIKDAHIDYYGEQSRDMYDEGKAVYDEKIKIEREEYEANFKENAESPTYDDLLRYPDTYKEKQIKISAKIVRVEPDGIIFDGDIEATMSGETIALYDGRETKEPKLREGDYVTIYGYGKGTTTVKVQDVSGWIPKTVDKYSIPAIDIRYIEFN